jgi:transposase-like protein
MTKQLRTFSPQEKAQVALAAIKGDKTMAQISSGYQVHPTQIGHWKKQALDNLPEAFKDNKKRARRKELEHKNELDDLYKIIGQRDIELDWLKKKLSVFNPQ